MNYADSLFASLREHLRVRLTPSDLGHRFLEHLVQQCFESAGYADADKLKNVMMAAAIIDQTELRLDKPPAVEDKFQNARLAFLNVLEIAFDVNKTGPEKDARGGGCRQEAG